MTRRGGLRQNKMKSTEGTSLLPGEGESVLPGSALKLSEGFLNNVWFDESRGTSGSGERYGEQGKVLSGRQWLRKQWERK